MTSLIQQLLAAKAAAAAAANTVPVPTTSASSLPATSATAASSTSSANTSATATSASKTTSAAPPALATSTTTTTTAPSATGGTSATAPAPAIEFELPPPIRAFMVVGEPRELAKLEPNKTNDPHGKKILTSAGFIGPVSYINDPSTGPLWYRFVQFPSAETFAAAVPDFDKSKVVRPVSLAGASGMILDHWRLQSENELPLPLSHLEKHVRVSGLATAYETCPAPSLALVADIKVLEERKEGKDTAVKMTEAWEEAEKLALKDAKEGAKTAGQVLEEGAALLSRTAETHMKLPGYVNALKLREAGRRQMETVLQHGLYRECVLDL